MLVLNSLIIFWPGHQIHHFLIMIKVTIIVMHCNHCCLTWLWRFCWRNLSLLVDVMVIAEHFILVHMHLLCSYYYYAGLQTIPMHHSTSMHVIAPMLVCTMYTAPLQVWRLSAQLVLSGCIQGATRSQLQLLLIFMSITEKCCVAPMVPRGMQVQAHQHSLATSP